MFRFRTEHNGPPRLECPVYLHVPGKSSPGKASSCLILCRNLLRQKTESGSIALSAGVKCLAHPVDSGWTSSQLRARMSEGPARVSAFCKQFARSHVCSSERTVNRPFGNIYIFGNINNESP